MRVWAVNVCGFCGRWICWNMPRYWFHTASCQGQWLRCLPWNDNNFKDIWIFFWRLNSTCHVQNRQGSLQEDLEVIWGLFSRMWACFYIDSCCDYCCDSCAISLCGSGIICLLRAGWWKSNTPDHQSSLLGWPPAVLRDAALGLGASDLLLTTQCFLPLIFRGVSICFNIHLLQRCEWCWCVWGSTRAEVGLCAWCSLDTIVEREYSSNGWSITVVCPRIHTENSGCVWSLSWFSHKLSHETTLCEALTCCCVALHDVVQTVRQCRPQSQTLWICEYLRFV